MNNIITLLKVDLKGTLDTRKFKENKAKSTSFLTFIILFGLLALFISVVYNLMFTMMFAQSGESFVYSTLMMAGLTVVLTFSTSVFKVKSIFMGKDYEMLKAMPVKNSDIISSKIISLYLVELLYSAIILIPNTIINLIFSKNFILNSTRFYIKPAQPNKLVKFNWRLAISIQIKQAFRLNLPQLFKMRRQPQSRPFFYLNQSRFYRDFTYLNLSVVEI